MSRANALLARIPPADRGSLLKLLTPVALTRGDVPCEAGASIRYVYFPLDCLMSLLVRQGQHAPLEVAVVGSEGMVDVVAALGMRTSHVEVRVQGTGNALRMTAQTFRDEFMSKPALRTAVDGYIHSLMAQLTRSVACRAFHPVAARCARWLLTARDRLHADDLEITHGSLAEMLGVRRVGVTVAAGDLQRSGAIAYSRGRVQILDAPRLAAAACDCYRPAMP